MFGEVLGMMSQELAQLPTDLQDQLISRSFPLIRTISKVLITFLTGRAATASQEGVLVPVKTLSWLHLGDALCTLFPADGPMDAICYPVCPARPVQCTHTC